MNLPDTRPTEPMTLDDARLVTGHIRHLIASVQEKIDKIAELLVAAYERRAWVALGYESWDAYVAAELRTDRLRLDRDDRQELVVQLRSAGMSTRAIGSAVGASHDTVQRDLHSTGRNLPVDEPVRSLDGRQRPATQTPRARDLPQAPPPDEPVVEEPGTPAPSVTPKRDIGDVLEERMPGTRADMARTALRARWSKDMAAVADIDLLDMAEVRSLIDDSEANVAIGTLRGVADRLERAGRPGLRIVGGRDD